MEYGVLGKRGVGDVGAGGVSCVKWNNCSRRDIDMTYTKTYIDIEREVEQKDFDFDFVEGTTKPVARRMEGARRNALIYGTKKEIYVVEFRELDIKLSYPCQSIV